MTEILHIKGRYDFECLDAGGRLVWAKSIDNIVATIGKNLTLDTLLAGSNYSVTGPYVGLISSVGYGAGPVSGDTMASHAGWNEAGNGSNYPNWSTPASNARGALTLGAAAAGMKATSSPTSFTIATNGGTVKGGFVVLGSGAVATNNNTSGTLLSAAVFSGGDLVVGIGFTVNVSWTLTLTG